MSIICIDLGDKRCGIAISNESIAFAHKVVVRSQLMGFLKKYVLREDIKTVVVGLPFDLYNKDTRQLDKTLIFIEKLKEVFPKLEIIWHDERFSSFQANEGFDDHRDDIAAQCILQSYIDSIR